MLRGSCLYVPWYSLDNLIPATFICMHLHSQLNKINEMRTWSLLVWNMSKVSGLEPGPSGWCEISQKSRDLNRGSLVGVRYVESLGTWTGALWLVWDMLKVSGLEPGPSGWCEICRKSRDLNRGPLVGVRYVESLGTWTGALWLVWDEWRQTCEFLLQTFGLCPQKNVRK